MGDSNSGQGRGTTGRTSRLPLPRPSLFSAAFFSEDNTKTTAPSTSTRLPSRINHDTSVSSSEGASLKYRYGWNTQSTRQRNLSPVTDNTPSTRVTHLDTTPPSAHVSRLVIEDGNENAGVDEPSRAKYQNATLREGRRKPRPSLSERTIETLSQIPPSPSPSRRRSSIVNGNGSMRPPSRPASALRMTESSRLLNDRPLSPSKRPFRPPGRSTSPIKQIPPVPRLPPLEAIYTPPRAYVRDRSSRIAKPPTQNANAASGKAQDDLVNQKLTKLPPTSSKARSMHDLRGAARLSTVTPSTTTIPTGPGLQPTSTALKATTQEANSLNSGLPKPRSRGEIVVARSAKTSAKPLAKRRELETTSHDDNEQRVDGGSTKSSATLRQAIAKAKAEHKAKVPRQTNIEIDVPLTASTETTDSILIPQGSVGKVLKARVRAALVSGVLNIAAMGLKGIPDEVLRMYEFDASSTISWAETVDLTKVLAADNELEELPDSTFPDWSREELASDAEKTNQFYGLEILDLHGNKLHSLPLGIRRLPRLRMLNLTGNKLDSQIFDVLDQLPALQDLRAGCNMLSSLPPSISVMTSLQSLDLRGNRIRSVPSTISKLRSLQMLDLSDNAIDELSLTALENLPLTELNVSRNALKATLFVESPSGFGKLRVLNASNNEIEQICEGTLALPSLQTLAVQNNRLSHLPRLDCPCLITLTVSDNRISEFPVGFEDSKSLRNVDLCNNEIRKIDVASIASLEQLTSLELSGNPLRDRKFLSMNVEQVKLELARRLQPPDDSEETSRPSTAVWIGDKGSPASADSVFKHKPQNGVLDLSSQNLGRVDITQIDMSNERPIHTIRLSNNDLTAFPVDFLSDPRIRDNLRSLNMSHNPLLHPTGYLTSTLPLPRLESLYVVSTGLTSLGALGAFLDAPNLKELNISCHRLAGPLPHLRQSFPALTTLLATDNWFQSVDVEAVRGLEVLDIQNNEVEVLPPRLGLLGNHINGNPVPGRLRVFSCSGNRFRVPRLAIVEKGTEAVLKDLRRMVPFDEIPEEWKEEI